VGRTSFAQKVCAELLDKTTESGRSGNCPPKLGGQQHRCFLAMLRGVVPRPHVEKWQLRKPPLAASDKTFDAAALLTQEGSGASRGDHPLTDHDGVGAHGNIAPLGYSQTGHHRSVVSFHSDEGSGVKNEGAQADSAV
jgi:hypothetical protein